MKAKQEVMIRARETQLAQKEREAKLAKAELRKQKGKDKANVMIFLFFNEISSLETHVKSFNYSWFFTLLFHMLVFIEKKFKLEPRFGIVVAWHMCALWAPL